MTTTPYNELQKIAESANRYMANLNGETRTFEIESDTLTAVIAYSATLGYDKGDYNTAPCGRIESERVIVEAVYNEDGNDTEAVKTLNKMLN